VTLYTLDNVAPQLPAGFHWIAPTASVIGKVELAEEASVWFGAVLRGDTELISVGARSNIQDNALLHTDAGYPLDIAEDCTIGHGAILHGCTLGAGSLVGMGAIVLNGARLGEYTLIGAGALVTGGLEIPPRSLVLGSPAKVVRELRAEELESLSASAAHYVANARRFAAGLALRNGPQSFEPA
jgi:carbonic anhydrase/acetyltransferase-like protein (isoleucine patch superfamily)